MKPSFDETRWSKAAADSARAMGEVLQKWARRVGKLDIINDQTKLREAWIDTIRDLAQDTVVRMRAKEMTMARPGAVMPK